MFDAFTVTVREIAELLFIVAALWAYLLRAGRSELIKPAAAGLASGAAISAAIAAWFLKESSDEPAVAVLTLVLAVGVAVMATSMLASQQAIGDRVHAWIDGWLDRPSAPFAIFCFTAVVACRESLELAVFVNMLDSQVAGSDAFVGAALGLLAIMLLVVAWRMLRIRSGLLLVFRLSTLLLALLSIQLALEAIGQLAGVDRQGHNAWAAVARNFVPGGVWYPWLCAGLMLMPLYQLARGWWTESARQTSPQREDD